MERKGVREKIRVGGGRRGKNDDKERRRSGRRRVCNGRSQ